MLAARVAWACPSSARTPAVLAATAARAASYGLPGPFGGLPRPGVNGAAGANGGTGSNGLANGLEIYGTVNQQTLQLVVTSRVPITASAGTSFAMTVAVENSQGQVNADFDGSVAVSLTTNTNNATLGGTVTVMAQNGVASFSALTINKAGSYAITATSGGVSSPAASTIVAASTPTPTPSPTPTPTPTPSPTPTPTSTSLPSPTIVTEGIVTIQKKNAKGKAVGKLAFGGFYLKFSEPMNPATAGRGVGYRVLSRVVKKGKKSTLTTLNPVASSVSYSQSNDTTMISVSSSKPFAKGGEIVISGVTSASGATLSASDATLTIFPNARAIALG